MMLSYLHKAYTVHNEQHLKTRANVPSGTDVKAG